MRIPCWSAITHLFATGVLGGALLTQVGATQVPSAGAASETIVDEVNVIRVDVSVVNVLCTVRDRKGGLVDTLDKAAFEIREDGKPQQIVYFSRENNIPLTVGLLFDSSVSQERLIPAEREASELFFNTFLQPHDAAFLIGFDASVELLQDVSSSKDDLRDGLGHIRVHGGSPAGLGPFPSISIGGTHLFDAVFLAAEDVIAREAGRKALILITDGQDQGSKVSLDRALRAAHEADAIIYGILFVDQSFYGSRGMGAGYSGDSTLRKMAEQTGGRVFRADNDTELNRAFNEISQELRTLYSIGYSPTNSAQDGSFRKIDVRTKTGGMKVQARKGYYALDGSELR